MGNKEYSYRVEIEEDFREGGYFVLTSKGLPGFFLGGKDLTALREDIPAAIVALYKHNYEMDVEVRLLCDEAPNKAQGTSEVCPSTHAWSAIPTSDSVIAAHH